VKIYHSLNTALEKESKINASNDLRLSIARLVAILILAVSCYYSYYAAHYWFALLAVSMVFVFRVLIIKHRSLRLRHAIVKAKIKINEKELDFLENNKLVFENGSEFVQTNHAYSHDLDFFGEKSLFQTLNRTGTSVGKRALADALLSIQPQNEIIRIQKAIGELTPKLEWRQHFAALGQLQTDNSEGYTRLLAWAEQKPPKIAKIVKILAFSLPILIAFAILAYKITDNSLFSSLGWIAALSNFAVLISQSGAIKNELTATTKIEHLLKQYAHLLGYIEQSEFGLDILKENKDKLQIEDKNSSKAINELSVLFGRLEHVTNVFASPLLNGLFQYHVHVLLGLVDWRNKYGMLVREWLGVIGEYEKYSSMANFAYNNPDFVYPQINNQLDINFEHLGHPLIAQSKRVTNSISFENEQFFILTGSNMSGKSTFLRTVGLNMVLAGIGAPVCASNASVHPLPVLVSMRLSDSLSDSESYFYAEVKRLKYIMEQLENEACFVLLDEILRGTNSDDKREGTMEVVRKMAHHNVFGGIATHDLEVCTVSAEFPKTLTNKRFEVAIVNDELLFDYKLQDGICQNKSASFIMKKMGVI
jgi:DNA mismatch repair ATPase MutS